LNSVVILLLNSANLPIFDETLPLHLASKIPGVRAVFGEVYPNPVRVVSIGKPVITSFLTAYIT
jgi:alanyl-tRNA synthetase